MSRLAQFIHTAAGLAIAPSGPTTIANASAEDDLLGALGDLGWSEADGVAGDIGWEDADGLAGLLGDLSGAGDEAELGRRVRRAANQRGMSPQALFGRISQQLQRLRGGGGGGPVLNAAPGGSPRGAFMSSIAPGTPQRGERFSYMPFPASAFVLGGANPIVLKTTAQRYIRPVRMAVVDRRTGAVSGTLVSISEVKIGQEVQPAATGDAAIECFSPFAVGIPVQFDPIEVNMPVEVTVKASTLPAGTDRIDFTVVFFGWMLK